MGHLEEGSQATEAVEYEQPRKSSILAGDQVDDGSPCSGANSGHKQHNSVDGLVGGSIVSRMLRHMADLQIGTAVQIGWFRGLAALFQAPGFRQWLTSGLKIPDRGKRVAALQVALPQISEVLTQELGDDSATVKAMMAFFGQVGGDGDTE